MTTETAFLGIWRELGPEERLVILRIAERLAMGRKVYGPIDPKGDSRSWTKEASEEFLDACVYMTCEAIRREPK